MSIKTLVGLTDKFLVETFPTSSSFVPCDKQDSVPAWIKRKGNTPDTISHIKPQFFHIRMA
jgi:hypothetical protein